MLERLTSQVLTIKDSIFLAIPVNIETISKPHFENKLPVLNLIYENLPKPMGGLDIPRENRLSKEFSMKFLAFLSKSC